MRTRRLALTATFALLVASLATAVWLAARLFVVERDNGLIASLAAGHDLAISAEDPPALLFARLHFLTTRDRLDEAQPLLNRLAAGEDQDLAVAALYDMANARLRVAFNHLESNRIDPAIPLVRLAKDNYRRALVLAPGFWDGKYNLDIAMRLVRDFPQIDLEGEELPPDAVKKLWTDLPGLPRGLP
jgi:mxaK protein